MPGNEFTDRIIEEPRQLTEETARRLLDAFERTRALSPVRRIRNSQIASAVIGSAGLALFIVGVENAAADIPLVSNPYGSIVAGMVLLAFTGALLARLGGGPH